MHANVGDEIVVEGAQLGHPRRTGVVLEVREQGGVVHYRVRWADGHETIYFPGSDAHVVQSGASRKPS